MLRFLLKFLLICGPALALVGYLEVRLSGMDTHYYAKRLSLEKQLGDIEVLSLGSSNAYYDINPAYFSHRGYNLAFNAQSPYYDYHLLAKYIDRMPRLKVVILPAIFYTMGSDLTRSPESWRMFFYRQYFGIPLESDTDDSLPYLTFLEPRNFSKIALYGANIPTYMSHQFHDKVDYDPESNGWFSSDSMGIAPARLENRNGEQSAAGHSRTVDISQVQRNLAYWQKIADRVKARHIKLVVVRLPAHSTYYENLDQKKLASFEAAIAQFANRNHCIFVDYTKDPRFTLEDYTFMIDHMNTHGAEKFSRIFDLEVLKKIL